jgi:hypothetical protein
MAKYKIHGGWSNKTDKYLYVITSAHGTKALGEYPTKAEAQKALRKLKER